MNSQPILQEGHPWRLSSDSGGPRSGSKVREALDGKIGKPRENRSQIVAHWEFQPAAAFHDRENRRHLRSRLSTAMCIQFFQPRATGRIEFSARLLLSSSSGYSRNRVSYLHTMSAYWQALLSALEGNATDCAASILLRISFKRGLGLA